MSQAKTVEKYYKSGFQLRFGYVFAITELFTESLALNQIYVWPFFFTLLPIWCQLWRNLRLVFGFKNNNVEEWSCNTYRYVIFYSIVFTGIGVLQVTLSLTVLWYVVFILAWVLYFLYSSLQTVLPWTSCDNSWNTPQCLRKLVLCLQKVFVDVCLSVRPSVCLFVGQLVSA